MYHLISIAKKKRFPIEFWKKENGDRLEIKIPILTQYYDVKIGHHPYLAHLTLGKKTKYKI